MLILFKNVDACKKIDIPPNETSPDSIVAEILGVRFSVLKSKQPLVSSITPLLIALTTLGLAKRISLQIKKLIGFKML